MDDKKQEKITRSGLKERIHKRLDYLRMNDNNATIPVLAIEVALQKVKAEVKEVMDDWEREAKP